MNQARIAAHANKTLHDSLWDSAEVLEQETNWLKRRFKEVLRIHAIEDTMNLDLGLQLNPIWSTPRTMYLTLHYIIFITSIIASSTITSSRLI